MVSLPLTVAPGDRLRWWLLINYGRHTNMDNYEMIKTMSRNELAFVLYSFVLPFMGEVSEKEKLSCMRSIKSFLSAPVGGVANEDSNRHTAADIH